MHVTEKSLGTNISSKLSTLLQIQLESGSPNEKYFLRIFHPSINITFKIKFPILASVWNEIKISEVAHTKTGFSRKYLTSRMLLLETTFRRGISYSNIPFFRVEQLFKKRVERSERKLVVFNWSSCKIRFFLSLL